MLLQNQLFSTTSRVAETSKAAFKAAKPKQNRRQLSVENHLRLAGDDGLLRHELAAKMKIPLSSVCSLARVMLDAGTIQENGETRLSPFGQPAKVLVLSGRVAK